MRTEVKTRMHELPSGSWETVMDVLLTPRGSGNRAHAQRVAQAFRDHPKLKGHIRKVVAGSSKVTVYLIPSLELMRVVAEWKAEEDVPGQLKIFPDLVAG